MITANGIALPEGRTDLTGLFLAQASTGQIETVRQAMRAKAALATNPDFNENTWAIYSCYYPEGPANNRDKYEDAPLRKRMWFGKMPHYYSQDYTGALHFVIDRNHWDAPGSLSLQAYDAPSWDYGHEVYRAEAPPAYRTRVEAEQEAIYREQQDEDDYEEDENEDDEDLF